MREAIVVALGMVVELALVVIWTHEATKPRAAR